jgi:hypothetical protein
MELAGLLDPNGIPAALFTTPAVLGHLGTGVGEDAVRSALRGLHRLSLATVDSAFPAGVVRVHALVQRATREGLTEDRLTEAARVAGHALLHRWPEIDRGTAAAQALRANALMLHRQAGDRLWTTDAWPVLVRTGPGLGQSGLVDAAVQFFRELVSEATGRLGPAHPTTMVVLRNLARWRGNARDASGAVDGFATVCADLLARLGPDHPDTLLARSNLARWQGNAGHPADAAAALAELVADMTAVLGTEHRHTLTTHRIQLRWRAEAGDPAGAADELAVIIPVTERVFGRDHPNTLLARGDLARWRGEAGDRAGAAAAFEALVPDMTGALGPEHPYTLLVRHDLIHWRGDGRAALAELLADALRVLGPTHPYTRITRASLDAAELP